MAYAVKTYRIPWLNDSEGYPKVNRAMTPEQYEIHKKMLTAVRKEMLKRRGIANYNGYENAIYACDYNRLQLEVQNTAYNWSIPYPTAEYPERTIGSSGNFLLISLMVLKYFYVEDVSITDLRDIALFGDWQHGKNGTYHHFVDAICEANGIETTRLSTIKQVLYYLSNNGLCTALLDNKAFPGAMGNCLVMITEVSTKENYVKYYFPGGHPESEHFRVDTITNFMKQVKVLWGFFICD